MRSPFTVESDTQIASESGEWEEALGTESVFEAAGDPELSFEEEFEIEDTAALRAGREEIPRVQLLSGHRATGPALILSWNDMPAGVRAVDVVVHLHGYALCPADPSNPWPKITSGGLDWRGTKGSDRSLGRVRPTLGILPRGHLFGGKTGAGYRFPALVTKTGLRQLIDLGLARLASRLSVASLAQGRLILTAHSGGGAALLGMLRYNDPQEIHIFDGLYQDPAMLIRWAKSRIARDQNALTAAAQTVESYMANQGGALRVLYRPGTATEGFSRAVERALAAVIPPRSELRKWYRVDRTSVGHCLIPRTYGWRFLADARSSTNGAATSPRSLGREEFDLEEEAATCRFGFTPRAVESSGGGRVTVKTPPPRVVNVPGVYRPIPLHPLAAEAWKALVAAARAEGHRHPLLLPTSGFRDPQRQRKLWERALVKYGSAKEARKWVAPPGGSAHQSGRAIDFYLGSQNSSSNVSTLRGLPAYRWLAQNAVCFGFYPYEREPWHWEYNPPAGGAGGTNPELETSEDFEWEEESWASQYAPDVQQAIAMGGAVWPLALQRAIKSGIRDSGKLANIAFFMHHPERDGRPISTNEPDADDLITLWKFFREEARKMLAYTPSSSSSSSYSVTPGQEYGGKWRSTRPPGLSADARQTGADSSALADVRAFAGTQGLGETFVKTVAQMAKTESGARYALPANNFNANPPSLRPPGKAFITAWGVFQFNRDAWTCLFSESERNTRPSYIANGTAGCSGCAGSGGCVMPWDCTPAEEIQKPILLWAQLYRQVRAAGGADGDAAGAIRLFHISPAAKKAWQRRAAASGFAHAWQTEPNLARVRAFLQKAGVALPGSMPAQELEAEEFEWEEESWSSQYPADVRQAIAMGGAVWPLALQRAIKSGIRDSGKLANIAFFMHQPERDGRPISANEPGASDLIALWKFFRDEAKKMLSQVAPASKPASSGSCRTTIPQVNTLMPESAPGLEAKKPSSHRYGLAEAIAALTEIGRRWQAAHPSGPLVRIRDISRCGGGKFPPHDSHRMGIDVDIGLMRNDGRTAAVNHRMQPSKYSQELTQEMVDTIRANGLLGVHRIWFSDKGVRNVTHDTSHNDHVHVRFCLPAHYDLAAMKRAAFPGGTRGTFAACTS